MNTSKKQMTWAERNRFARVVQQKRMERGMSQRDLAAALGISGHRSVTNWESGQVIPRPSTLKRLSNIFGCEIAELYRAGQSSGQ